MKGTDGKGPVKHLKTKCPLSNQKVFFQHFSAEIVSPKRRIESDKSLSVILLIPWNRSAAKQALWLGFRYIWNKYL